MIPSERILVIGVDYSDFCIPAVDEALRMAAYAPGARLIPLLALPGGPLTHPDSAAALGAELVERSKENLARLLGVRANALGVSLPPITPSVRFGKAADSLLAEARESHATHILVGTRGRRGLEHLLLGSVAEEVARHATCSVVVARAADGEQGFSATEPPVTVPQKADEEEEDTQELPRAVWDDAGRREADSEDDEAGTEPAQVLSEPHLEGGRLVLHVLDVTTGQAFVAAFNDLQSVRVEPLEGDWVPAPSSAARARAARAATDEARRTPKAFELLLEQITREPAGS